MKATAPSASPATWLSLPKTDLRRDQAMGGGRVRQRLARRAPPPTALELLPIGRSAGRARQGGAGASASEARSSPASKSPISAASPSLYSEPFRFDAAQAEGPATSRSEWPCPWQADFYECQVHWWPAQRPDDVLNEATYPRALTRISRGSQRTASWRRLVTDRIRWDRGVGDRWTSPEADPPPGRDRPRRRATTIWSIEVEDAGLCHAGEDGFWREYCRSKTGAAATTGSATAITSSTCSTSTSYPDFMPKARQIAEVFLDRRAPLAGRSRRQVRSTTCTDTFPTRRMRSRQRLDEIYAFYEGLRERRSA